LSAARVCARRTSSTTGGDIEVISYATDGVTT
jgi:hypothetical protein